MHPDEKKLRAAGYVTQTLTPYHFRFKKPKGSIVVNVWPTARKMLKQYSPGPAPYYTDVLAAAKQQFMRFPPPDPLPPEQQMSVDLLEYYRENWQFLFKDKEAFAEYLAVL